MRYSNSATYGKWFYPNRKFTLRVRLSIDTLCRSTALPRSYATVQVVISTTIAAEHSCDAQTRFIRGYRLVPRPV